MIPRAEFGEHHTKNHGKIHHTDFFSEEGYSRFHGWLTVAECLRRIETIKKGYYPGDF